MYPIDTLKTRLQLRSRDSAAAAATSLTAGLYNGLPTSLLGQVPYGVLTFGGYAVYKQKLKSIFPKTNELLVYTTAAIMGDLTGSMWLCPSEVVKQQIQGGIQTDAKAAVSSILSTDGVLGFYRGYFGNVARDVPFRVFSLVSYEVVKKALLKRKEERSGIANKSVGGVAKEEALSTKEAAICGAIAGSFSAAITCPLDKIKTMLMTGKYQGSVIGCLKHVVKTEGFGGLGSGMVPRVGLIGPSVAIFFIVYEKVLSVVP